jgi:phosphoglucomutase
MNEKSQKYLLDTITDETLAKLIDETIIIEKNKKTKSVAFKIIPAVMAIALVIGLANMLPAILSSNGGIADPPPAASAIIREKGTAERKRI